MRRRFHHWSGHDGGCL